MLKIISATIPILDFQKIIEENELWIACDDNWKQYHHWLNTEAHCKNCGRLWKDRPKDAKGNHTDIPWSCEVRCGCFERRDFSQVSVHLVMRKPS